MSLNVFASSPNITTRGKHFALQKDGREKPKQAKKILLFNGYRHMEDIPITLCDDGHQRGCL